MKMAFIAGPFYGNGDDEVIAQNIKIAEDAAIELANRRVEFFCPHTHTGSLAKRCLVGESFFRALCRSILIRVADCLVVLPGWEDSEGTKKEIKLAHELQIPIFYLKSANDSETLDKIMRFAHGAKPNLS